MLTQRRLKWIGAVLLVLMPCQIGCSTGKTIVAIGRNAFLGLEGLRGGNSPTPGWFLSYGWMSGPDPGLFYDFYYQTPTWRRVLKIYLCPFLLAAMLTTAFLWWRDRRRIPSGHCQTCGYDLAGNISRRCPECGNPA